MTTSETHSPVWVGTPAPDTPRLPSPFPPPRPPPPADHDLTPHRAYGLPHPPVTPEFMEAMHKTRINPTGELPAPVPITESMGALDKIQGYTPSEVDRK